MEQVRQFWRRLSARGQWLAAGGAALLGVVLLVFYVWQPLEKERMRLRASLPKLRPAALQMRADVAEVRRLQAMRSKASLPAAGLREAVTQSAAARGLQISQANAEGGSKLDVVLAAVAFDAWVKWLAALQEQQGIRLESCRVEPLPQPGMVKVQALLAKG